MSSSDPKTFTCDGNCMMCDDKACSYADYGTDNRSWLDKYLDKVLPKATPAVTKYCKPHQNWLKIGDYEVFLKSSRGNIHKDVDVFIDLTGYGTGEPEVPAPLRKYLDKSMKSCKMVIWDIADGRPGPPSLVRFVHRMLQDGLKVGWGCMGGHGRTGWLAAKLYKEVTGCHGDEAVEYVRDKYCFDAVESQGQLTDLGCSDKIKPTRLSITTYYGAGAKK